MKISPARIAAFDGISRIENRREFSSTVLAELEEDLSPKDRALCHELVLGTLRKQIYLDRVIDHLASGKLDKSVRLALRLGAYQLLYLERVPAYSAINESVNLVQRAKKTSAKGLVNAVLRKLGQAVPQLEFSDELDRLSVETSHPRWLLERWIDQFGEDETRGIAKANNSTPKLAFRLAAGADLSRLPEMVVSSDLLAGGYVVERSSEVLREMAARGEIYFQDEASQLVASVAADGSGRAFLDVCAAPGGKTTQIAATAKEIELIAAGDLTGARVSLLKATCSKAAMGHVQVLQYDAAAGLPFAEKTFDTVLVDAPCSGTGTIRHNPEIRYFVDQNDFSSLFGKQQNILENASKVVRGGGRLVYSTCSLETEENEIVCQTFLAENRDFELERPPMASKFVTAEGFARTFPHRDDTDGFYIAVLRRRG